ncbi:MAG: methylated-DNA--[protein]-cysteine S-methyltransferase [Balneolales bacterium]|nr:methylated-DNA--[protein]-cysteine S-methyltransferase [Balneolales bacterium]
MNSNMRNDIPLFSNAEAPNTEIPQSILRVDILPFDITALKESGKKLRICYEFAESPFGKVLIAATNKGICRLEFTESEEEWNTKLQQLFQDVALIRQKTNLIQEAGKMLEKWEKPTTPSYAIPLEVSGSAFQIGVWRELLCIPYGARFSYGELAQKLDKAAASRAVGSAIGKNPVALLIPCHRVVRTDGALGGYMWGTERKKEILIHERDRAY